MTPPFPFYRCTLDLAYLLRTEKSCLYRELLDKRSEKFKLFIRDEFELEFSGSSEPEL